MQRGREIKKGHGRWVQEVGMSGETRGWWLGDGAQHPSRLVVRSVRLLGWPVFSSFFFSLTRKLYRNARRQPCRPRRGPPPLLSRTDDLTLWLMMCQRTRVPTFCFVLFEDLFLLMVIASFARSSPAGRDALPFWGEERVPWLSGDRGARGVGRGPPALFSAQAVRCHLVIIARQS